MLFVDPNQIRLHLERLAGPKSGGRVRNTSGHRQCQAFLETLFARYTTPLCPNDRLRQTFRLPFHRGDFVNFVGLIPGRNTSSFALFGAHYDAKKRSPFGADDNASGVALLLELMRVYSSQKKSLEKGVIFVAFDGEEFETPSALNGSRYFAKHCSIPIAQIKLAQIFDLVGGTFFDGLEQTLFILGSEHLDPPEIIIPTCSELHCVTLSTASIEPFGWLPVIRRFIGRSDYKAFRDRNIPYLFYSTGTPFYYHTPDDQIDKVSPEKIARIGDLIVEISRPLLTTSHTHCFRYEHSLRNRDLQTINSILEQLARKTNSRWRLKLNRQLRWNKRFSEDGGQPTSLFARLMQGALANLSFRLILKIIRSPR